MAHPLGSRLIEAPSGPPAPVDFLSAVVGDTLQWRRNRLLARRSEQADFRGADEPRRLRLRFVGSEPQAGPGARLRTCHGAPREPVRRRAAARIAGQRSAPPLPSARPRGPPARPPRVLLRGPRFDRARRRREPREYAQSAHSLAHQDPAADRGRPRDARAPRPPRAPRGSSARTRPRARDPARGPRRSTKATNASCSPGGGRSHREQSLCHHRSGFGTFASDALVAPSGPAAAGGSAVSVLGVWMQPDQAGWRAAPPHEAAVADDDPTRSRRRPPASTGSDRTCGPRRSADAHRRRDSSSASEGQGVAHPSTDLNPRPARTSTGRPAPAPGTKPSFEDRSACRARHGASAGCIEATTHARAAS